MASRTQSIASHPNDIKLQSLSNRALQDDEQPQGRLARFNVRYPWVRRTLLIVSVAAIIAAIIYLGLSYANVFNRECPRADEVVHLLKPRLNRKKDSSSFTRDQVFGVSSELNKTDGTCVSADKVLRAMTTEFSEQERCGLRWPWQKSYCSWMADFSSLTIVSDNSQIAPSLMLIPLMRSSTWQEGQDISLQSNESTGLVRYACYTFRVRFRNTH